MIKNEHLPKDELPESLEFYLGVIKDELDVVSKQLPFGLFVTQTSQAIPIVGSAWTRRK